MWLQLLTYTSFSFFVFAFIVKAIKYARMPVHLRWELYPVANEVGHDSGGSYLEELDWWTRPQRKSYIKAIAYIVREAFLFKKCCRNNRGLWYFTYPFHMGLFLLIGWLILLFIGAAAMLAGISVAEGASAQTWIVHYLTPGVGVIGFVFGIFGGVGLLIKRLVDTSLRAYTAPVDYFNLSFILAILLSGLSAWYFFDPTFGTPRELMMSLVTFSPIADTNIPMAINIVLLSLFLIYMPFTHMMHGLAKYFTYHRVFWEDEPSRPGGDIEKKVEKLLNQPVSWSAPHIQSGKRWSEITSERPQTK